MLKSVEMRQELENMKNEVRELLQGDKVEEANAKMEEVRKLEAKIKLQEELEAKEKENINERGYVQMEKKDVKVDEYRAIAKYLLRQELTAEERASINVTNSGALLPQSFVNQVQVLTNGYPDLKKYCHVIPVTTNSGKMPLSQGSVTKKLAKIGVDTALVQEMINTLPIEFAVEDYGKIIPIDNSLLADSPLNVFNDIIAPDFAESSVNTHNEQIVNLVKANAVTKTVTDYKGIIKILNNIVPALKPRTIILTNLDGYDYLDNLTDNQGRPLLNTNLALQGAATFKGYEVVALDDTVVTPVTDGKIPFYIVNLYALVKFFDRQQIEVATSQEAGFTMNQTLIRVIERFDVVAADNRANFYIEL
jgi:HK97 family phage major capsid protein